MSELTESLRSLRADGPSPELELGAFGGVVPVPWAGRDQLSLDGFDVSGTVGLVPWGRRCERVALALEGRVYLVAREDTDARPGVNLAGEERDTLVIERAQARVADSLEPDSMLVHGALVRVAMMAGALERIAEIAIAHARERVQFGRPIGRFQAVQAHLVTIAQQAALVGVAADAAIERQRPFEIAAAKLLAGRAAVTAGRAAHQVLGARGVTLEHPLSLETRRLWSWRSEYGDDRYWSERLGCAALHAGGDCLYPAITAGSAVLEV
jgi:acyl-CoA dehydrogenase